MQRRTLLRRSAALGALALAGCSSDGDGNPGATPPPSGVTGFGEWNVETTNTDCLSGNEGSATVAFQSSPLRIDVAGTIRAPTPCYTAKLEGIQYDQGNDELRVSLAAVKKNAGGGCTECIGGIEYEATFNLEGELPGTVVVVHEVGDDTTEVARVASDQ